MEWKEILKKRKRSYSFEQSYVADKIHDTSKKVNSYPWLNQSFVPRWTLWNRLFPSRSFQDHECVQKRKGNGKKIYQVARRHDPVRSNRNRNCPACDASEETSGLCIFFNRIGGMSWHKDDSQHSKRVSVKSILLIQTNKSGRLPSARKQKCFFLF